MNLGKVPRRVCGDSKVKNEPQAGHAGIHGNSERGNHLPDTITLAKSEEILTNLFLPNLPMREGG